MDKKEKQRLDQLVRQGIVPVEKQSILMRAMASLYNGSQLSKSERDILSKYMHNMTDIVLKDTTVFNRAKLHTQKTKYRTEENAVEIDEKVNILDGPEALEKFRKSEEEKAKRKTKGSRAKFRNLPKELRREKMKAGLGEEVEDILEFNKMYSEIINVALEEFGFESIRDIPEEFKSEFFQIVDEAAKPDYIDIDGDGDKKEPMKKAAKDANRVKLTKGFGDGGKSMKANYGKLMKKEEAEQTDEAYDNSGKQVRSMDRPNYVSKDQSASKRRARFAAKAKAKVRKQMYGENSQPQQDAEQIDELKKSTLASYIKKASVDMANANYDAAASATKADRAKSPAEKYSHDHKAFKSIKTAMKRNRGIPKAVDKLAREEVEQIQELRDMIKEGNNKIGAYKLLSQILNNETGE